MQACFSPEEMNPELLPGHVWLDTLGKILHADERYLEFTDVARKAHVVPATGTGLDRSVVVPSPSCPRKLPPQQ